MANSIITIENLDGIYSVYLSGAVDSVDAPDIEKEIDRKVPDGSSVVVDCEKLERISSAGLRVFLRLKKRTDPFKIINTSVDVYDILQMTGFTDIMDISRAYRTISIDNCPVIGSGAIGIVYRIAPDTIVKIHKRPDSLSEIHRERELSRTAFVLGIPTAIPYDVVRTKDGLYGSVFELLDAKSYAQTLIDHEKTVDEIAEMSVSLLKQLHTTAVPEGKLPHRRDIVLRILDKVGGLLEEDVRLKFRRLLEKMPENRHLLHGDFQIKNVMIQNGESLLIDMDTLCTGDPVFELAAIFNCYCGYSELDHDNPRKFLGISYEETESLWDKIFTLYFDGDEAKMESSLPKIMAVGHLNILDFTMSRHDITEEWRKLQSDCSAAHINELIKQIDSLQIGTY